MVDKRGGAAWYGDLRVPEGSHAVWRVGPLELDVQHLPGEWRVACRRGDDIWSDAAAVRVAEGGQISEELAVERYLVDDAQPLLSLQPLLPDRPVVTRPVSPVYIPAGEAARFYVSMPLWLRLAVGEARKALTEIPTLRLSDTWFGANTLEGELCYALRSRCRLTLEDGPVLPYRVVTPLVVRNQATDRMLLERINVPVRQLSLFVAPSGQFWTGEVTVERTEEGHLAALKIDAGAPAEARDAAAVAGPRDPLPRKAAIRAFSALFQ